MLILLYSEGTAFYNLLVMANLHPDTYAYVDNSAYNKAYAGM